MPDFSFSSIKEKITKKEVILATMALAVVAAGTAVGVAVHSSSNHNGDMEMHETAVRSYSLEMESGSNISAFDIYEKLAENNTELRMLTADNDSGSSGGVGVVVLAATVKDSGVDVEFSDGSSTKDFLNSGVFKETLVIHNKADNGVSEIEVSLTIRKAVVTTVATTKATTTTTTVTTTTTAKTTKATTTTTKAKKAEEKSSDNGGSGSDDYSGYDDYDYDYDDQPAAEAPVADNTPAEEPADNSSSSGGGSSSDSSGGSDSEVDFNSLSTYEQLRYRGYNMADIDYAMSQGCDVWQAVTYCNMKAGGLEIFIGTPPVEGAYFGVWSVTYNDDGTVRYAH